MAAMGHTAMGHTAMGHTAMGHTMEKVASHYLCEQKKGSEVLSPS